MGEDVRGIIVRLHGLYSYADTDEGLLECTLRRKIGHKTKDQKNLLCVGDRVRITRTDEGIGVIEEIEERRTQIARTAVNTSKNARRKSREHILVANLDRLFIVTSAGNPLFNPRFADRLIIAAESREVVPMLVLNKVDLPHPEADEFLEEYRRLGYEVLRTSALEDHGLDPLKDALRGHISAFMGQSGVGKTSLLRALLPGQELRVHEVSDKTGKGMHTTTHAELFPLGHGGYIVDTPGIREFGLHDVDEGDLALYFPEFREFLGQCKFSPCSHLHEPGCAVREAVGDTITEWRYKSYQAIYQTILDGKPLY